MKKQITSILIASAVLLTNCTSGQNSPADSHPGSGSVKAGRTDKASENKDTSNADSLSVDEKK